LITITYQQIHLQFIFSVKMSETELSLDKNVKF